MNRRTSIKYVLALGSLSALTVSVFKWSSINQAVNPDSFSVYKTLIADLAETIIPRTDTPGAKDVKTEDFIIKMLELCTDPKTQHYFLNGLSDLKSYTLKTYNHDFLDCTSAEKIKILEHFENKSVYSINILNKIQGRYLGTPFFMKLKELTVEGYCTSQRGATEGLAYDYIPSTYQGCIPLKPNQKSWATN